MLWAEPVRAPGATANSPTSATVLSLMGVECRNIFRPSLLNEQWIDARVSMSKK
jgi:hypothetical protein